ncbi:MAG: hypothetical protein AAF624_08545 [Bacteroidota bacterium]
MEAVLAIFSMFVILPTIIFTFVFRMRRLKLEERLARETTRPQLAAEELRMSELQALIEDAVDEATAPLYDRIAALERGQYDQRDPLTGEYVDDSYLAPNGPVAPKTVGRTRS